MERAIQLRRQGDCVVVSVEAGGQWVEVIRERFDGSFCHVIEPAGVKSRIHEACDEQSYSDLRASGGIAEAP